MKPMGWSTSLILFGMPAVFMFVSFHAGIPLLIRLGLTPFEAFIMVSTLPMALMFAAALAAVVIEQSITTIVGLKRAVRDRMRFPRLTFKAGLLSLGLYLVLVVAGMLSGTAGRMLIESEVVPVPENVPLLLDPQATINAATIRTFVGGQLVGNWEILALFCLQLFFNIAGEELWWRGYILPRQELTFGRWAWLVHGLLWWVFHAFKWWDLVTVLPLVLLLSYVAQRTKNNWIPTIAHLLANLLLVLLMAAGVLGLMS
jgi:membrane protease YdiL (CAAX protease family)